MDRFEFLSVLLSIILAFGISTILSSWGQIIRMRREVRPYWVHSLWSVLALLVMIQLWWSLWEFQELAERSFFEFVMLLGPYCAIVLLANVITPDIAHECCRDLERLYYADSRWIFGLATAYLVGVTLNNVVLMGQPLAHPENGIRLAGLSATTLLATTRDRRVHEGLVVFCYGLFLLFMGHIAAR